MPAHIFIATSLDGFIARPNGAIDWLESASTEGATSGEDYGYHAFMATVDAIVMGRHSYEKVLTFGAWPYGEKPVVVLTSKGVTIAPELQATVSQMAGTPAEVSEALAGRGWRSLYVDGGVTAQGFLRAGLVERMIVTRIPVLIGQGIPLFGPLSKDLRLQHIRTTAYPTGLVQSEYRALSWGP